MRKYGVETFEISLIEETNKPEEREVYWIEQYRTFKNGYNATKGGDGKRYLDYDLIIATYKQLQSLTETSKQLKVDTHTISNILKTNNVSVLQSVEVNLQKFGKIVYQYDKEMNFIQAFPSTRSAASSLGKTRNCCGHISDVCQGKRKTAYGYIWRYADNI